jgi:hypothetical protein
MDAQSLIVALIVIACGAYAIWTLMPAALRRALAQRALRHSLPELLARPLRRAAKPAGACGGCDSCGEDKPSAAKTVQFHRRLPR